jgi:hypothetical protein
MPTDDTSIETRQEGGEMLQTSPGGLMTPWVYDKKFLVGTQFLFGTSMFTIGEDGNLELQVQGQPPRQCESIYGKAPYYPTNPPSMTTSTLSSAHSCLIHCAGPSTLAAMTSWGHLIRALVFWPSAGSLSHIPSGTSINRDSTEDYHEIGGNIY